MIPFWRLYTIPCLLGHLSILAGGNTKYSQPCVSSRNRLVYWFFAWPGAVSFHACWNSHIVIVKIGIDPSAFSLCSSLVFGELLLHTLASLASLYFNLCLLNPVIPLISVWVTHALCCSRELLLGLICFSFPRDQVSWRLLSNVWKSFFSIHFVWSSGCLRWKGKLVPVTPSWQEVTVPDMLISDWCLRVMCFFTNILRICFLNKGLPWK